MPKISTEQFKELLKNDGFEYVLKSKVSEPIRIDFPNLPDHHQENFDDRHKWLPDSNVICFEYKGMKYKLLRNMGFADANDGNFGAVFDGNNEKVVDLISSGDMETTIKSVKTDDVKSNDEFTAKLAPYLICFEVVLHNCTELEYLIFKVFVENGFLYELSVIDERYEYEDDTSDDGDS